MLVHFGNFFMKVKNKRGRFKTVLSLWCKFEFWAFKFLVVMTVEM